MNHFFRPSVAVCSVWLLGSAVCPVGAIAEENESWFVVEFDGKKVGYEYIRWQPSDANPEVISCFRKTEIRLERFGSDINLSARLATKQDLQGRLLEFELTRVDRSGVRLQRSGVYEPAAKQFAISELRTGTRAATDVAVGGEVYSPILSLWMPRIVGQQYRRAKQIVFFPESNGVAPLVVEYRTGKLVNLDGQRVAVERLNFYPEGDPSRLTTLSYNSSGQVVQQEKRVLGGVLKITRTTPELALTSSRESVNVDAQSLIPLDGRLGRTNTRRKLELKITATEGALDDLPESAEQTVRRLSASELVLTLNIPDANRSLPSRAGASDAAALASTRWLPLSDPALQKMATFGVGATSDAGEICRRFENHVFRHMKRAPFETSLNTAAEVAQNRRGDCTEHAVLLAALMRIRGVPSRVASGLVPVANGYGFQGHTWVEAKLGNEWVAFDSAAPSNRVRIKLHHDTLADSFGGGIRLFLPILDLVGRTKISVIRESSAIRP